MSALAAPYLSRVAREPALQPRREPVVRGDAASGPLTDEELARFDRDGYLVLDDLFSTAEAAALLGVAEQLGRDDARRDDPRLIREPDGTGLRSVFEVHRVADAFADLARDARLVERARQILDDDVYVHQSRVNRKPGFDGREFWWHSDFETWHYEDGMPEMRALSFALALTPNLASNGSLMIVPGSHRWFVGCAGATPERHYERSLRKQEYGLPSRAALRRLVDEAGAIVTVTGTPGSLVLFDCNAMHGSAGNITPYPRSAVFLVYNAVSNALVEPFGGTAPRPEHVASRQFTPLG